MKRFLALALLATLLAGSAAAQVSRPAPAPTPEKPTFEGGLPSLNMGIAASDGSYLSRPFLVVGADNRVNVSVFNYRAEWLNDTVALRTSNAASLTEDVADRVAIRVPPGEMRQIDLTFRPDDASIHLLRAELEGTKSIDGTPLAAQLEAFAAPAVSLSIVDPVPVGGGEEGYVSAGPFGGGPGGQLRVRIRPDESIEFRVEARNLRDVASAGFEILLRTGDGENVGSIDVPALDARESRTFDLPPWSPGADPRYAGCLGCTFQFEFLAYHGIGGGRVETGVGSFRFENGAVEDLVPAVGAVEVQESLVADVLIPKEMRLGLPARIKANVSNYGSDVVRAASLRIVLQTPNSLHYGVQGPEVREFTVRGLAPGDSEAFAFEFTPRVTGAWSVYSLVREAGTSMGGGGTGFLVEGPVTLGSTSSGVLIGRIGERVEVDVSVHTTAALDDAVLRVVAQTQQGFGGSNPLEDSGTLTTGIAQRVVRSEPDSVPLGTMREGDVIDATFTLVATGSGTYQVTPFVVAGGFAYTSTANTGNGGSIGMPVDGPFFGGPAFIQLAIQPRPVGFSWAFLPLTLIVTLTVGAWTLRTRFVR